MVMDELFGGMVGVVGGVVGFEKVVFLGGRGEVFVVFFFFFSFDFLLVRGG